MLTNEIKEKLKDVYSVKNRIQKGLNQFDAIYD